MSSSNSDSALTPRSSARARSPCANSFLNQLTSQKPRWIWISVLKAPGQRRGVGGQQALHFDVLRLRRVDGGGGAEGQVRGVGRERAAAEHFAGLVGGSRDHRQAGRQAELGGGRCGQGAQTRRGRHEARQLRGANRQRFPVPLARARPLLALVVERQVADLAGGRVDPFADQPMRQPTREQGEALAALPDRAVVLGQPVGLGLALQLPHQRAGSGDAEGRVPEQAERRRRRAQALVGPDDRRAQRRAVFARADDRAALRRQRQRGDACGRYALLPQQPAGLGQCAPVGERIFLGPAGLWRIEGRLEHDLRPTLHRARAIEGEGAHALRADVDGENQIGRHGRRLSAHGRGYVACRREHRCGCDHATPSVPSS